MAGGKDIDTRKDSSRAAQASRARLLLKAHLGWLGGYPGERAGDGVAWRGARVARIDRAALAGSTRARSQLHRDHARVLPLVLGEVKAWDAGVGVALRLLKATVHDGAPLGEPLEAYPDSDRRQLARLGAERPGLAALLAALVWIDVATPAQLRRDLAWIAATPGLEVILAHAGLEVALQLRQLAVEEGAARVAPLVALLGDLRTHEVPATGRSNAEAVVAWLAGSSRSLPARPTATLTLVLVPLCAWLIAQPSPVRRRGLAGLVVADLPARLSGWAALWKAIDRAVDRGRRIRAHDAKAEIPWEQLKAMKRRISRALAVAPPSMYEDHLLEVLQSLASDTSGDLLALAESLPLDETTSATLAVSLVVLVARSLEAPARPPWLETTRRYFAARGAAPAAGWRRPFQSLLFDGGWVGGEIEDSLRRSPEWRRWGDALIALGRRGQAPPPYGLERLARLCAALPTVDAVLLRFDPEADWQWHQPTVSIAAALSDTPEDFRALGARLGEDHELAGGVAKLLARVDAAARPRLASLLRAGQVASLAAAGAALELLARLGRRDLPRLGAVTQRPAAWIEAYPPVLRDAIARLEAAGASARRQLDPHFPAPEALRSQLEAIDRKLATRVDPLLARRRATLARQLAAPPSPSPARLARLAADLERAAERAELAAWRARLDARLAEMLTAELGLPAPPPAWLVDPRHRKLWPGLLRLTGPVRALAGRLLVARSGPSPWDLRDEPANRAFLDRLRARGVDPSAWLSGIGVRRVGVGERALELSLEDDPLEILMMGEHFRTCLSTDEVNFFSAVVNAADVNKRVIYARARGGTVVGRCLIGLTDDGDIVTFEPYSHDGRSRFAERVRDFVAELAGRLGRRSLPGGVVRPLLARQWYDDGARDLTGRFAFLAHGSELRKRLASLRLDRLVAELERAFAPEPLSGYPLGLVLALTELDTRPELVVPLLPLVDRASDLPLSLRLRAAHLARRAGAPLPGGERLLAHLEGFVRERMRSVGWIARSYLDLLVELSASRTLSVLRDTRERRVRRLEDDAAERIFVAAAAHAALGRRRKAAELYRLAGQDDDLRAECQARLAALEATG